MLVKKIHLSFLLIDYFQHLFLIHIFFSVIKDLLHEKIIYLKIKVNQYLLLKIYIQLFHIF